MQCESVPQFLLLLLSAQLCLHCRNLVIIVLSGLSCFPPLAPSVMTFLFQPADKSHSPISPLQAEKLISSSGALCHSPISPYIPPVFLKKQIVPSCAFILLFIYLFVFINPGISTLATEFRVVAWTVKLQCFPHCVCG